MTDQHTHAAVSVLGLHPRVALLTIDFFDTLVTRAWAQPTHVFAAMETELVAADPAWRGFARDRVEAERRARRVAAVDDPHRDVTLAEIWCELARVRSLGFKERERLAKEERRHEVASARPAAHGVAIAEEARRRGLEVVVVSDNYMPASHLADMARAAGIGWIDEVPIWVSCERGAMKHDGRLFDALLAEMGVPATRVLHVGDDPVADGESPASRGIAVHVDTTMRSSHRHMDNTAPSVLALSRIEASLRDARVDDAAAVLGGGAIAMVVASQVDAALREAISRGARAVHFAARDGHLAHQLWQRRRSGDGSMPPASYLSFSRSVVWRAGLKVLDADNVHRFVGDDEVLDHARLEHRVGCPLVSTRRGPYDAAAARAVLVENAPAVLGAAAALRSRFVGHLDSCGILEPGRHVVVDLGWTASTVADLADLVAEETDGASRVEGLFTGLYWDATANRPRLAMRAVAMDEFAPLDDNLRLLGVVKFLEALVTAPHGSVVDFDPHDFSPVGAVTAPERRAWDAMVSRICGAALESAAAILDGTHPSGLTAADLDGNSVWAAIMQVAHTPRDVEVEMLGRVHHVTDIDHEGDGRPMIAPVPGRRTHLTDTDLSVIHDALIRRHWMRGTLASWRRRADCAWMVDEIERIWPHTHPVWVHPGAPR